MNHMYVEAIVTLGVNALTLVASLAGGGDPLTDSLPIASGIVVVEHLTNDVTIERDGLAVPIIRGEDELDVARGQGFVHAQERFFQMDLARRYAAGELAELAGGQTLAVDLRMRPLRLRRVAEAVLARLDEREQNLLLAYTEGVNSGLHALGAPPPEYTFTLTRTRDWSVEDCLLVMLSLFDALHMNANYEERLGIMQHTLPSELFDFLTPSLTRFDAPLIDDLPGDMKTRKIPDVGIVNVRERRSRLPEPSESLVAPMEIALGSNNWAVAGRRSAHGGAMVANDPHLMLSAPVIWYRCELRWPDHRLVGASLPGVPGVIIGSNEHVAWGFTNTSADFQDLIVLEIHPTDPTRYRTPDRWRTFVTSQETILVRGAPPRTVDVRETIWGPVNREDALGRSLVLKWTGLDPQCINLDILRLAEAQTVDEALAVGAAWYGPSQNMIVADSDGRIGWVITGYLPNRAGFTGKVPTSWASDGIGWTGARNERLRPRLVDPPSGILYTANNRTTDARTADQLANFWALGVRASRIRDLLLSKDQLSEADLLSIQLDTRLEIGDFYRELALAHIERLQDPGLRADVRELMQSWNGRADIDQRAVPFLNAFRSALLNRAISPLVEPSREVDESFRYGWWLDEEPLRTLLEDRPMHLLVERYESWGDLIVAALNDSIRSVRQQSPTADLNLTWGQVNRANIAHPFAQAIPQLARMLNMPADPLPGHPWAVRVAASTFGASLRMVVSPGRESSGIFEMPCGESGHPVSPHYRDQHSDWLNGAPTPFLPGATTASLTLTPSR